MHIHCYVQEVPFRGPPCSHSCVAMATVVAKDPPDLAVLLARIETDVPHCEERDKILSAGKQLQDKVSQRIARSLAGTWDVRQYSGGANKTVAEMVQEGSEM